MPQLSLYIDEKTLRDLEIAAAIERLSISKFVVKKIKESIHRKWPDNYEELFGSIDDKLFVAESKNSFNNDSPRENL